MNKKNKEINFAFFGTPDFAVTVLDELKKEKLVPSLVVTTPDKPKGRGLKLTPSPVRMWAEKNNINFLQPKKLDADFLDALRSTPYALFIISAYGKIIPREIIELPKHGTLNVHPSLLPKYRGPSPVETQILSDDREAGVTIMLIDEEMDHGPLLAQTKIELDEKDWPPGADELEDILAHEGGALLAHIMPKWVAGEVKVHEQDHEKATYCKLIKKEDALINLDDNSYKNYLKIKAYSAWPRVYFFTDGKRLVVTDAEFKNKKLKIKRVIPEGKKEMSYEDFWRGR